MTTHNLMGLVHLVGFLTGIVLYMMLAVMTRRRAANADAGGAPDRIPMIAAVLGLVWNVGALVFYGMRDLGLPAPGVWPIAISFTALGLLPAVVVHSAVRPWLAPGRARQLIIAAYGLSVVAGVFQFAAASAGDAPSRDALRALTVGYALIFLVLVWSLRGKPRSHGTLTGVGLAAFAVSALHLSHHHVGSDSLGIALLGHHASLPLVLVILYQDYRFAFMDLFLKRAFSLLALVALASLAYVLVAAPVLSAPARPIESMSAPTIVVGLWVATAIAYPMIRRRVDAFVDRVMLNRADYTVLRADLVARLATLQHPEEVLDAVGEGARRALDACRVTWYELGDAGDTRVAASAVRVSGEVVFVRVPTTDGPAYGIEVREMAGGRRLLSDDIGLLDAFSLLAARRIDELRAACERLAHEVREHEMRKLATEAELRALRAQINPHFLFNALTTIGYLVQAAPERAVETLYRLTGMLRAVLRPSNSELVTIRDEMEIVESYLAIERARFEERLEIAIDVPDDVARLAIPPLLLQPLVENAVKHGVAPIRAGGRVSVIASVELPATERDATARVLSIVVHDTGAGAPMSAFAARDGARIGLSNVERRLARYYGAAASLRLTSEPGHGTTAEIRIPLEGAEPHTVGAVA